MRLGMITLDYSAKGFDRLKNMNFQFAELCCNNSEESKQLVANKNNIKEQIKRTGIDVSCIGRWNHSLNSGGKIDAEKEQDYFDLLDTAIDLGAKTFNCGINYDNSISYFKNCVNAIEFFTKLVKRAENSGTKVAVQNCSWNNFVKSPDEWKIILDEVKGLYLKFDASHAYYRGEDYLSQLSDWCERVAHIHIKGMTKAGARIVDDPPAGMDDLKWPSIFAILYSRNYDGDLSIEPHSPVWRGELADKGIIFTRDYVKKFILR